MNWPWAKPETRQASVDYTDRVVSEILARATGTTADVRTIAATEAAVGTYGRCIASATLTPSNLITASVTPEILALAGRGLATRGNFVAVIEVEGGAVRLAPVAYYNVSGEADPASWMYRCDLAGPSRQRTRRVEASGVVHFRINAEPSRPWDGRSPLEVASATGKLSASVEQSLQREQAFLPARVVYTERQSGMITEFLSDISKGGLVGEGSIDETTSRAASQPPHKIGPVPDEQQVALRTETSRAILSAYGLSPALFEAAGDGSGQREAWRRAWASVFLPITRCMASELAEKLDPPGVELALSELRASDSMGQGRAIASRALAVKHLTEAGVTVDVAREVVGI